MLFLSIAAAKNFISTARLEEWLGRRNTCPLCVKKIFIIHDCFTKKTETFQDPPNRPFVPAAPPVRLTPCKASDELCSIISYEYGQRNSQTIPEEVLGQDYI